MESHSVAQAGVQWRNLSLQGPVSSNSPASASQVARLKISHLWLIFVFLVETGFHHVGQVGLELLTSSDLPTLASQNAGITGVNHPAGLYYYYYLRQSFVFVAQAEVQWHSLGSLQPLPSGFK